MERRDGVYNQGIFGVNERRVEHNATAMNICNKELELRRKLHA